MAEQHPGVGAQRKAQHPVVGIQRKALLKALTGGLTGGVVLAFGPPVLGPAFSLGLGLAGGAVLAAGVREHFRVRREIKTIHEAHAERRGHPLSQEEIEHRDNMIANAGWAMGNTAVAGFSFGGVVAQVLRSNAPGMTAAIFAAAAGLAGIASRLFGRSSLENLSTLENDKKPYKPKTPDSRRGMATRHASTGSPRQATHTPMNTAATIESLAEKSARAQFAKWMVDTGLRHTPVGDRIRSVEFGVPDENGRIYDAVKITPRAPDSESADDARTEMTLRWYRIKGKQQPVADGIVKPGSCVIEGGREDAEALISIALAEGWKSIRAEGTPSHCSRVWRLATEYDIEVANYRPNAGDLEWLASREKGSNLSLFAQSATAETPVINKGPSAGL